MNRYASLFCLAILGCGDSEDQEVYDAWVGLYEVTRFSENTEACDVEGDSREPAQPNFQFGLSLGDNGAIYDITECPEPDDCYSVPRWGGWLDRINKKTGVGGDATASFFLTGTGFTGSCTLFWNDVELAREGNGDFRMDLYAYTVIDAIIESEEECVEYLDTLMGTKECDVYYVLEGSPVK